MTTCSHNGILFIIEIKSCRMTLLKRIKNHQNNPNVVVSWWKNDNSLSPLSIHFFLNFVDGVYKTWKRRRCTNNGYVTQIRETERYTMLFGLGLSTMPTVGRPISVSSPTCVISADCTVQDPRPIHIISDVPVIPCQSYWVTWPTFERFWQQQQGWYRHFQFYGNWKSRSRICS